MLTNKTAAMFELDARIALAIFGALSVITGAALFSAIENSKATALLTEMQEVGKAWEAYYLDTAKNLPLAGTTEWYQNALHLPELITSTKTGWNGPYLKYKLADTLDPKEQLAHPKYFRIYLILATDSESWGDTVSWHPTYACSSGNNCFIWSHISGIPKEIAINIDKIVDKGNGPQKGNFRYRDVEGTTWGGYLKIAPYQQ